MTQERLIKACAPQANGLSVCICSCSHLRQEQAPVIHAKLETRTLVMIIQSVLAVRWCATVTSVRFIVAMSMEVGEQADPPRPRQAGWGSFTRRAMHRQCQHSLILLVCVLVVRLYLIRAFRGRTSAGCAAACNACFAKLPGGRTRDASNNPH